MDLLQNIRPDDSMEVGLYPNVNKWIDPKKIHTHVLKGQIDVLIVLGLDHILNLDDVLVIVQLLQL